MAPPLRLSNGVNSRAVSGDAWFVNGKLRGGIAPGTDNRIQPFFRRRASAAALPV